MEFLLPHLDEFVLDFDAEEALLQAQMLAAGQLQQAVPVEPVQLDSQLDALRREIARREQQKLKQGTAKAAPARPVSNGNAGARLTQRGENPASSLMLAGTANRCGAALKGPPVTKRARMPSAQAAALEASAGPVPETRSTARVAGGPSPPAAAGLSSGLIITPSIGALTHQNVGSKLPPTEVRRALPAQQPRLQPKPQQAGQKLQQSPSRPQPPDAGFKAADVRRSQPVEQRTADLSLQHVPQQEPASSSQGANHNNESDNVVAGAGQQHGTPIRNIDQHLQGIGAGAAPGMQQSPSQGGPGPPRKRPRTSVQRPGASRNAPEAAGCLQDSNCPGAANTNGQQQAVAPSGVAGILTASSNLTSAPSGSQRVRPATGATSTASRQGAGNGGKGLTGPSDARLPKGSASALVQGTQGQDDAQDGSSADICPEAEQAATEFLMSFMTQIGGEGDRSSATAMALQAQGQASSNSGQGLKQCHPLQIGISPGDPPPVTLGSGSVVPGRVGNGCAETRQLTGCERNALVAGSGGGASARRAAAERTSAAVQRLRRKSSGVATADSSLRTVTPLGMAGVAGIHVVHAAAADMAGAADSRAAGTSAIPPAIADGMPSGTAPLEACDLPHPGRGGDASGLPLLATTVPPSSKCQQDGALIRSAQQSGDLELNAQAINRQLGREVDTTTSATEGALAAARGAAASVGEALALEPAGVVSSTMAPLLLELGVHDARSQGATGTMPPGVGSPGGPPLALSSCPPGLQAGAAVHTPSWPQLYSAGWGCPGDRYQMGAGHGTTLGEVQPQQQLEQSQQPGVMPGSGATSHLTGALTELGMHGEPGTVAPQTNTPPSIAPPGITASATVPLPIHAHPQSQTSVLPFRHGATFGLLATTAALQLPFLPPPPAIHPPVHAGGPFPGAIPHVPPPRAQWRSSLFGEVPLGGGQPAVSLVEMDVMVRKELILLRWHMLQELAAEIEAEWMEACHAHNRLRLLSMAQSVSTTAAGAVDSADVLGLQVSTHQQPQDTSRACYSYSGAHSHPGLHSLDSQDQESQHQQQEQRAQEQQRQTQQQLINLGQAANPQPAAPMQPPVVLPAAAWATASEALRTMEQTESHSTSRFNALEQAVVEMLPAALRKEAPVDAQEPLDLVRPSFSSDQQAVARHAQHPDQLLHAAAPIQTPALMLEPGRTPEASRGAERSERAALEAVEVACAIGVPVCGSDVHGNWQSGPNVVAPSAEDRQHPGWTQTALDIPTPGTAVAAGVGTSDGAVIVRVEAATWPVGVHFPGLSVIERPPAENPEAVVTASEAAICTQRQDRQHCTQIWQRSDVSPTFHVNVRQGGADADADAADITAVLTGSDTRASPAAAVSNPTVAATRGAQQARAELVSTTATTSPPQLGSGDGGAGGTASGGSNVPRANTELGATVWIPWGDGSVPAAPAGLGARTGAIHGDGCGTMKSLPATVNQSGHRGGTSGNAAANTSLGDGRADENGQTNQAVEAAAPFTGLSFKLSTAPLAGRRVAAMRAQSGTKTPAIPIPVGERKRAPASVPAVVSASVVQPRSRNCAVVGGASAASASAVAAVPLVTVAAAPAEPLVHVQSASQVQSATRARGGSPGNAVASTEPAQAQQESQTTSNINIGSAGVHEVTRPATNTASHVQVPRAAAPREKPAPRNFGSTLQPATASSPPHTEQHSRQLSAQGCSAVLWTTQQQVPSQQAHQQEQQQSGFPQLASPSAMPLYQGRQDIVLRGGDTYGAASTSALGMLTRKYMSPLRIFRSYSGGGLL
ncbi:hypothetical protein Vretimale_589 [Volvox reticuliferus]|uniref:Uncharacterized protein n=1 Tax=Volvox reticuliferus TaxID=1737510 RepID=A0A8J4C5F3_9CHLO|nr:hypothetical protein Vretifemale_2406 [Volvox reticuliferus]GIL94357.1 hypothetical protein Vretimale_589 [Volvox reticuliferus]